MNKDKVKKLSLQTSDTVSSTLKAIRNKPVSRTLLGTICLCAGAFFLASCDKKGPAERAGEKVDDAVENAGDKIEDATD